MTHTKRHKKSKSARKRTLRTNTSSSKKYQNSYARNKKRNSIIRNIRMGRSTFNRLGGGHIRKDGGGGYTDRGRMDYVELASQNGGGYISQFIGSPWTVSNNLNTGNYFAPSPLGVGTGNVPKFEDGQPINHGARWPTQNGPQLAKLGEMKGGRKAREITKGGRNTPQIEREQLKGGRNTPQIYPVQLTGGRNTPQIDEMSLIGGRNTPQIYPERALEESPAEQRAAQREFTRGGGVFDDIKGVYNNIVSSATNFGSKLEGIKPPPSSYAWDQPISRSSEKI